MVQDLAKAVLQLLSDNWGGKNIKLRPSKDEIDFNLDGRHKSGEKIFSSRPNEIMSLHIDLIRWRR